MTDHVHLVCENCTQLVRPQRVLFGYTLCDSCFKKTADPCTCERCSRNTFVMSDRTLKLCFRCERNHWFEQRPCKRCGRSLKGIARKRFPDSSVSCAACATMCAEPVACSYCGEIGLKRSRDHQRGFAEPACSKCQRAHANFRTCAGCKLQKGLRQ